MNSETLHTVTTAPCEYRIINIGQLAKHVGDVSLHAATCQKAAKVAASGIQPIRLTGVKLNNGLAALLSSACV